MAVEGALGRRKEAAEGEGGKRVILRRFQGHVAQSPGLSCQDHGEQLGEGGGKGSMGPVCLTLDPDRGPPPTPASSFGSPTV